MALALHKWWIELCTHGAFALILLELTWDRRSDFVLLISPPYPIAASSPQCQVDLSNFYFLFLPCIHKVRSANINLQRLNPEVRGSCHLSTPGPRWRTPKSNCFIIIQGLKLRFSCRQGGWQRSDPGRPYSPQH